MVAADGTFGIETTEDGGPVGGVQRRSVLRLSGQIVGPVASGTVRARLTFRRARPGGRALRLRGARVERPCRRRDVTGAGGRVLRAHEPDRRGRSRSYSASAARACRWRPSTTACAAAAASFAWENITPGGPIAPDGTFSLSEQFTRRWREGRERFRVRLEGLLTPTGVSGTLSVSSVLRSPGGRVLDRCATGRQTFSAVS